MNNERFTQGQWVVNESVMAAVNCGQKHIAMINIYNDGTDRAVLEDECLANAHLISAAPDMYAALYALRSEVSNELWKATGADKALAKADGEV